MLRLGRAAYPGRLDWSIRHGPVPKKLEEACTRLLGIRPLKIWKPCVLSQSYGMRESITSSVEAEIFERVFHGSRVSWLWIEVSMFVTRFSVSLSSSVASNIEDNILTVLSQLLVFDHSLLLLGYDDGDNSNDDILISRNIRYRCSFLIFQHW